MELPEVQERKLHAVMNAACHFFPRRYRPDGCIAAARVLVDVLERLHVRCRPLSVVVDVFNPQMVARATVIRAKWVETHGLVEYRAISESIGQDQRIIINLGWQIERQEVAGDLALAAVDARQLGRADDRPLDVLGEGVEQRLKVTPGRFPVDVLEKLLAHATTLPKASIFV